MKKSAIRGYASELLLLTVRTTDNVPFLEKYAVEMLALGKHDEHSKLAELVNWASVLETTEHFREDGIPSLCENVKKNIEQISPISYELITSVRLLKNLAVAPRTNVQRQDIVSFCEVHFHSIQIKISDMMFLLPTS